MEIEENLGFDEVGFCFVFSHRYVIFCLISATLSIIRLLVIGYYLSTLSIAFATIKSPTIGTDMVLDLGMREIAWWPESRGT